MDVTAAAIGIYPNYGLRAKIPTAVGGTHYGVWANVQKAGSYAGFFQGDVRVASGGLLMSGNILPQLNNGYDIGSPTFAMNQIYAFAYPAPSYVRLKNNIQNLNYGLAEIEKLLAATYVYKVAPNQKRLEFIAQETEKSFPKSS